MQTKEVFSFWLFLTVTFRGVMTQEKKYSQASMDSNLCIFKIYSYVNWNELLIAFKVYLVMAAV